MTVHDSEECVRLPASVMRKAKRCYMQNPRDPHLPSRKANDGHDVIRTRPPR